MSIAMNRVIVFPVKRYVHSPDGELLYGKCPGIIKTVTQGLARTRIALCQRPGVLTRKKPDVMI